MKNVRFMVSYLLRHRSGFTVGLVFILLATVAQIVITAIQKVIIDDIFLNARYDLLFSTLVWFAVAILGASLFSVLWTHIGRVTAYRVYTDLSKDLMTAIYRTPTGVYHSERIGKYLNYFTSDVNMLAMVLTQFVPNGIANVVTVILLSVIIGWSSPGLLVAILLFSTLYLLLGKKFALPMRKATKELQEARGDFLVHMEEGVASTREVIAFHREEWERKKMNEHFQIYYDAAMKEGKLENKKLFWSDPLKWGATLIVLVYGGYLVMQNHLSIGMYVVIFQFTAHLMTAIHDIYHFTMAAQSRLAMVDRIRSVIQGPQVIEGKERLVEPVRSLELQQVSFRYSEQSNEVLKDLTLHIPIGKKVAFVGTSGGGKSTIAQLFIRFYDPVAGSFRVNGKSLCDIRRQDWMGRLAVVFQDPYLFPDTIRHNLLMGMEKSDEEIREACRQVCMDEFIHSLEKGYETELGERGINLSGGQKQRLALARALLRRSELLILDEATSSLDLETERQVQRNIDEQRAGLTTIIIAHRLSTVQNADLIYVMDQGTIAEQGTHQELMNGDTIYKKLVYSQMDAEAI